MLPIDCRKCQHIAWDDRHGYFCACLPKDRPCKDEKKEVTNGEK